MICSYQSRFLNKSKSSALVALQLSNDDDTNTGDDSDSKYGTGRSRYLALKERRSRLARSRSSHFMGKDDDGAPDHIVKHTTSPNAYLASRCEPSSLFSAWFNLLKNKLYSLFVGNLQSNNDD